MHDPATSPLSPLRRGHPGAVWLAMAALAAVPAIASALVRGHAGLETTALMPIVGVCAVIGWARRRRAQRCLDRGLAHLHAGRRDLAMLELPDLQHERAPAGPPSAERTQRS